MISYKEVRKSMFIGGIFHFSHIGCGEGRGGKLVMVNLL